MDEKPDYNAQQDKHEVHYRTFNSSVDLTREFHRIRQNHTKENMVDDLVKMSALMKVMKERNILIPGESQRAVNASATTQQAYSQETQHEQSGANGFRAALGFFIMFVGVILTAVSSGDTIFYGAILVGLAMMIGGLVGG